MGNGWGETGLGSPGEESGGEGGAREMDGTMVKFSGYSSRGHGV